MDHDDCEATTHEGPDVDVLLSEEFDDATFRALSERRRRLALYYLQEHDGVPVDELADVVAGVTGARESTVVTPDDRESVEIELRHSDLPVLADVGLVVHDRTTDEVSIGDLPESVRSFLAWAAENE